MVVLLMNSARCRNPIYVLKTFMHPWLFCWVIRTPLHAKISGKIRHSMKHGYLCGFRQVEAREGEIELVLYLWFEYPRTYSFTVPGIVREVPFPAKCESKEISSTFLSKMP